MTAPAIGGASRAVVWAAALAVTTACGARTGVTFDAGTGSTAPDAGPDARRDAGGARDGGGARDAGDAPDDAGTPTPVVDETRRPTPVPGFERLLAVYPDLVRGEDGDVFLLASATSGPRNVRVLRLTASLDGVVGQARLGTGLGGTATRVTRSGEPAVMVAFPDAENRVRLASLDRSGAVVDAAVAVSDEGTADRRPAVVVTDDQLVVAWSAPVGIDTLVRAGPDVDGLGDAVRLRGSRPSLARVEGSPGQAYLGLTAFDSEAPVATLDASDGVPEVVARDVASFGEESVLVTRVVGVGSGFARAVGSGRALSGASARGRLRLDVGGVRATTAVEGWSVVDVDVAADPASGWVAAVASFAAPTGLPRPIVELVAAHPDGRTATRRVSGPGTELVPFPAVVDTGRAGEFLVAFEDPNGSAPGSPILLATYQLPP